MITVFAPAKINLFLSVGALRRDGYHEIETIFQAVSLFDTLTLAPAKEFTFDVSPEGSAPEDETNLVVRAARALWASTGKTVGANVALKKLIPMEAGLGGGSADAAGALVGLNALWNAALSRKSLEKVGAALGADVAFCVRGGTAAGRGRGELLSPIPCKQTLWWVIVRPRISLRTQNVYAQHDVIAKHDSTIDPHEIADALARGSVPDIARALHNDLEPAALSIAPALSDTRDALQKAGAVATILCGSGSAWAGLCNDEEHAKQVGRLLASFETFVVHSLDHGPRIEES
ncbi:MAG: 4-(cytidine 5'-diphospho)-2-C-methyl-D-erythritol kinase [Actinomycetota bacterium]